MELIEFESTTEELVVEHLDHESKCVPNEEAVVEENKEVII